MAIRRLGAQQAEDKCPNRYRPPFRIPASPDAPEKRHGGGASDTLRSLQGQREAGNEILNHL